MSLIRKDQPSMSEVHTNRPLTNISIGWEQSEADFVARNVFPVVPSPNQSNTYYEYDRTQLLRTEAQRRASGAVSAGSGWNVATTSFTILRDAIHKRLADPDVANADSPLNMAADAARFVARQLLLREEIRFQTAFFASGVWTTDTTPGVLWDDAASTPIEDIKTRARAMLVATGGYRPNQFTIGQILFDDLSDHADILDRIKYTGTSGNPAIVDQTAMAALFRVEKVNIASAVQNTAAEGATASNAFINSGRDALLSYSPSRPSLYEPSAGYTFTWSGAPGVGGSDTGFRIKSFRDEPHESDVIEGEKWYTHAVISADLGEYFSAATSNTA